MRDLMHMAKEHKIESKLYHGDAIDKIHGLLGHARFRKWLSIVCDEDAQEGKQHWKELLTFLEKEVKIAQQEMIWSAKMTKKEKSDRDSKVTKNSGGVSSHHANGDQGNSLICSICGADDHVKTSGPGGSKLIQYYVCQKFTEMNCNELH